MSMFSNSNGVILDLLSHSYIKQGFHSRKKNIDIILKCAINGNRDQAKVNFEELVSPSDNQLNEQYNLVHIVGMIFLLGQTVAESVDFLFTKKIFLLYSKFLQDIRELDYNHVADLLPSFFNSLWNELCISGQGSDTGGQSNKIIEYVRKNYHKGIGVNEVAKDLHINPSYMSRIFKNEKGITVKHFITHYRMNIAAEKLVTTNLSVQQISEQCGYRDLQAFRKTFKEYFNMSPNQYRNTTKTYC